jgi:hypothetical protein
MQNAFEKIFNSLTENLQEHLNLQQNQNEIASSEIKGSGSVPFSGQLDGNGNFSYSCSKYGAGVTVSFSAIITDPDAIYSVHIKSSDGGDYNFTNIHINQPMSGKLGTSFWHNTTLSVTVHSDTLKNVAVHGSLNYSY